MDRVYTRPRAPSDASRSVSGRPFASEANSSGPRTNPNPVSPASSPRGPGLSPTTARFQAMDRYFSPSSGPSTGSRVVRVKKSMPELDGVWKGFLEDVNENVDSIRLDLEWVNDAQTRPQSRDSDTPRPRLLDSLPTPISPASVSMHLTTSAVSPARPRAGSRSEAHLSNHCTGDCCTFASSGSRKGSLTPSLSPASPRSGHERDISTDFPLSLFPIPPPLNQTPTLKNRPLPDSSATVVLSPVQLVDVVSPPKPRPPPRSPARRQVPHPLDMRPIVSKAEPPPSPNLDSPPLSTPTTPRFPQSPPPSLRTISSVSALKKKTSGGPGGHPFTTPLLPTPPTTPDHFGYTSTSPEPFDPYRYGRPLERPGLRPVHSSSQLRGHASPPPGAHRATMSESVHATGTARTPQRPLVVSTTHGPLQGDAYLVCQVLS